MFALPIFPGSRPPSIVGTNELNFCVRDGNRWTLIVINTNYSNKSFPSPRNKPAQRLRAEATNRDTAGILRLRNMENCITSKELVTHTGFEPMLTA